MSIIRWRPFADIDKFLDDLSLRSATTMDLATDIFEENGNLVAQMSIAGIDPEKVDVVVEDDYLKVTGSRDEEKVKKERGYFLKEIKRGKFERIIDLPVAVDPSHAKAEFKDGVLRITMPKQSKKESHKIKVEKSQA